MAEAKKKTETIRLFSDGGKYKGDLFVSVNGVHYQLQRGKNIEVPPEVAEVIRHSQEQDDQTAARMEELRSPAWPELLTAPPKGEPCLDVSPRPGGTRCAGGYLFGGLL